MNTLRRQLSPIRMRNYGRIIQDLVAYTCTLPEGDKQRALTIYIGQCMRQKNIAWNKDADATVGRIKRDIQMLSDGKLLCDIDNFDEIVGKRVGSSSNSSSSKKKKKN